MVDEVLEGPAKVQERDEISHDEVATSKSSTEKLNDDDILGDGPDLEPIDSDWTNNILQKLQAESPYPRDASDPLSAPVCPDSQLSSRRNSMKSTLRKGKRINHPESYESLVETLQLSSDLTKSEQQDDLDAINSKQASEGAFKVEKVVLPGRTRVIPDGIDLEQVKLRKSSASMGPSEPPSSTSLPVLDLPKLAKVSDLPPRELPSTESKLELPTLKAISSQPKQSSSSAKADSDLERVVLRPVKKDDEKLPTQSEETFQMPTLKKVEKPTTSVERIDAGLQEQVILKKVIASPKEALEQDGVALNPFVEVKLKKTTPCFSSESLNEAIPANPFGEVILKKVTPTENSKVLSS